MLLVVPGQDKEPWPTFGREVCDFIEDRFVYGPGSLQGQRYKIDPEFRAFLYRAHEVYPGKTRRPLPGGRDRVIEAHPWAGRRRFKRVGLSVRKGLAKTEKEALIVGTHIHPEGPGRCDGFDAHGEPVAAPVRAPYVPMLAYSLDQVEELAYAALKYILERCDDADLFDVSLERALRLDEYGRADGGAYPLAQSPDARDGARTTLNAFDEPHRLYLPRHKAAHDTMDANLPKRPLDDPWSLYVGTAGELGQGSVAEDLHEEALQIRDGRIERPDLFYLYRTDDDPKRDLRSKAERIKAITEATGPAGEWGPGQFDDIASKWDRPKANKAYLERVWLNRWDRSAAQAFDVRQWADDALKTTDLIRDGAFVTAGFDGARFRDSTGIVITDIIRGTQRLWAGWEKPLDWDDDKHGHWEIPEAEVQASVEDLMGTMKVWRFAGDPPYWVEPFARWSGRWPDQVVEWWTNKLRPMAFAVRDYAEAINTAAVTHEVGRDEQREAAFDRHIGAAGRKLVNLWDDEGQQLCILEKLHPERRFDYAMAAVISWRARLDAIAAGATTPEETFIPTRIR